MAPNKFLIGSTTFIIFSASMVSAKMLPITKEPKAALKPTFVEITAIRKQSPNDTISKVSLFRMLRVLRKKEGMANKPITNHKTRKNPIMSTLSNSCPPSGLFPLAIALSITIMTMARMSSRIRTLMTVEAKPCCKSPMSANALYIMAVELMANIPPRNIQSICFQPKPCPTETPNAIIENTIVQAAIMGEAPIFNIFLTEKSNPNENKRKMTPISAHVFMSDSSITLMM